MNRALIPALASAAALTAGELSTDYSRERTLKVVSETTTSVETTSMSMTRDGEPVDVGGRGGGTVESTRKVVCLDTVLAHEDGRPTKVKRVFDEVEGSVLFGSGEDAREIDRESPLDGETLILTIDDEGDVIAEMEEGEPDDSAVLQGHSITLALDALLPEGDVEVGDSWEPEGEDLITALGMHVELFPRSESEDEDSGDGRRGRFRSGGGSTTSFFRDAEWDCKATLTDRKEDVDGVECVVIELEFEADGDLPEGESTYEVQLEGELLFSVAERRPARLEIEGELTLETEREFDRGDVSMTMERTQEGRFEHVVTVTQESM